jgi:hypothetical protein
VITKLVKITKQNVYFIKTRTVEKNDKGKSMEKRYARERTNAMLKAQGGRCSKSQKTTTFNYLILYAMID